MTRPESVHLRSANATAQQANRENREGDNAPELQEGSYYPRIVEAVREILTEQDEVAPVDVFVRMGLLEEKKVRAWHLGRVSYLERVINCNLARAGRILRILRMHGHDLQLGPVVRQYRRRTAGPHTTLRFTKTRNRRLEEDYSRHYAIIGDPRKFRIKHRLAPFVPTGDHG